MVQGRLPARYRVLEEVGQGGMAVVYRAHDEALKREVAVKLLHSHLLAEPESKTRLEREAQAVAKLHHDNIVQIFDYSGVDSAASYIVTEFIDGQTLKQFMTNRKPPAPEVASLIALEIASALMHAHGLGIIHRDVKPDNVMVRKDGFLKLMDFGVAQIMDLERMTVTGQLLGSPAYMAPEILEGKPLDVRTDVFSVGIMLYQLATGSLPFSGRNPHEVLKRIAEGKFADPRTLNRLVPDRLARIIAKALARKPEERYPTVSALLEDLRDFVADAGLTEVREELQGFFQDPDGYSARLMPRMVTALVESGKREREARRTARALELWNRALAIDPTNRDVLAELRRLEKRQHAQRGGIIVAAAGLLALGGLVAFKRASSDGAAPITTSQPPAPIATGPGPRAAIPAAVAPTPAPVLGAPVSPSQARPVETPSAGESVRTGRAAPRAPRRPERRTITLVPVPWAKLTVDGEPKGDIGPGTNTVVLDWDRSHSLTFSSPCCFSETKTVGPDDLVPLDDTLRVALRGRPAIVTVTTDPNAEGKVGITEVDRGEGEEGPPFDRVGRLGAEIQISFSGDRDMRKVLLLTVDSGGRVKNERVEIRAGQKIAKTVKLGD